PAALLFLWLAPPRDSTRRVGFAWLLVVFVIVVAPFTIWAVAAGHPPGAGLVRDASFYLSESPERTLEARFQELAPGGSGAAGASSGSALAARIARGVPSHLGSDARVLLGWPIAALAAFGLGWIVARRRSRV